MKKGAPKTQPNVICIGAGVVDHYVRSKSFETRADASAPAGIDACFPLGSKLTMDEIIMQTGGGATNAAATFASLKMKPSVICRVGKDVYGDVVVNDLEERGVQTTHVQVDKEEQTGQSIIFLSGEGHRSILVRRGASALLNKREIPWASISPRWFYITSLAGDLGLVSLILDRAEACGASVFWNPGGSELKKGLKKLMPLIQRTDVFDVNREEAAELAQTAPRRLKAIVNKLGNLPKMALLLSDGPKGAYLHTRCCTWYAPPLPGKRVNTTGAGDALGSGFVAGFLKTCDLSVALKVGMMNATGVIMAMGAKAGILERFPEERALKRIKITTAKLRD